ncbi:phospholipase D precursor [mine drainage metagenome]|uniref:Phospholipase D n=1 Tax=mine drainage metagenome TaxID=410659 RepID=A0A1J5R5F5_9ZZZZ
MGCAVVTSGFYESALSCPPKDADTQGETLRKPVVVKMKLASTAAMLRLALVWLGVLLATHVQALELPARATEVATTATVRAVFTPGDDVAAQVVAAIAGARRQVLVQAYSFTHEGIARALLDAHRRGVEVKLIADREQTEAMAHGMVAGLARAGVAVWLDGEHLSAHNKVMVIDAGTPDAVVITGSFNFTRAAQYKNAENVIFISGSEALARAYAQNWQRHLAHSQALSIH